MKLCWMILLTFALLVFAGCNSSDSPTSTLKKFVEASKQKDVEAMKQSLSSGTLKMIEDSAKKQNTTLEELLKQGEGSTLKGDPETREEKIEGDAATVEVKNPATGDFDKIPFVKEDGKWKIALDKFMRDVLDKIRQEMTTSGSNPPSPPIANTANNKTNIPAPATQANKKP